MCLHNVFNVSMYLFNNVTFIRCTNVHRTTPFNRNLRPIHINVLMF